MNIQKTLTQDCWNEVLEKLIEKNSNGKKLREARTAISNFGRTCKEYYKMIFEQPKPDLGKFIVAWNEEVNKRKTEAYNNTSWVSSPH